jgi:hypothetical protein
MEEHSEFQLVNALLVVLVVTGIPTLDNRGVAKMLSGNVELVDAVAFPEPNVFCALVLTRRFSRE